MVLLHAVVAAACVACSSSTSPTSTGTPDSGSNPCEGMGCASMPGDLLLHVDDEASGNAVAHPAFSEKGHALTAWCVGDAGFAIDAGASCTTWSFEQELSQGPHDVTVSAAGYASQVLHVTLEGPSGCCGTGPNVEQTVQLARSAASDASAE